MGKNKEELMNSIAECTKYMVSRINFINNTHIREFLEELLIRDFN